MKQQMNRLLATAAVLCGMASPAAATQVFDPLNASLGINSNATRIWGTVSGRPFALGFNAEAWTAEVFANQGECLRLEVLAAFGGDLALGVAAPTPLVYYRDNDSGAGDRPLVKIIAPFTGWYSVIVGSFNAQQELLLRFPPLHRPIQWREPELRRGDSAERRRRLKRGERGEERKSRALAAWRHNAQGGQRRNSIERKPLRSPGPGDRRGDRAAAPVAWSWFAIGRITGNLYALATL